LTKALLPGKELAWCNDPESYAGGSVATGRATLAGQFKENTQTKRDTLALQVGGWACCQRLHRLNNSLLQRFNEETLDRCKEDEIGYLK